MRQNRKKKKLGLAKERKEKKRAKFYRKKENESRRREILMNKSGKENEVGTIPQNFTSAWLAGEREGGRLGVGTAGRGGGGRRKYGMKP